MLSGWSLNTGCVLPSMQHSEEVSTLNVQRSPQCWGWGRMCEQNGVPDTASMKNNFKFFVVINHLWQTFLCMYPSIISRLFLILYFWDKPLSQMASPSKAILCVFSRVSGLLTVTYSYSWGELPVLPLHSMFIAIMLFLNGVLYRWIGSLNHWTSGLIHWTKPPPNIHMYSLPLQRRQLKFVQENEVAIPWKSANATIRASPLS